jgi:hypothetical protein
MLRKLLQVIGFNVLPPFRCLGGAMVNKHIIGLYQSIGSAFYNRKIHTITSA